MLPNIRGSSGYGKTWINADNIEKRLDVISDIQDAGVFAKKYFSHDGQSPKVGVMGGSYGGYAALMAMTYFSGTYDAGVSNSGISNFITYMENTAPRRRIYRENEYGSLDRHRDILKKLSPMTYIDQIKSPMLIIQGVNDPRVPAGEALQFYQKLQTKNVPADLIFFADEGHGASSRDNIAQQIGHTISFFKKHFR
jgi:dipeptidyl aminopeptidase/acylaminoacyl peptidase